MTRLNLRAKNLESDAIYSSTLQAAEEIEKADEQLSQVSIIDR